MRTLFDPLRRQVAEAILSVLPKEGHEPPTVQAVADSLSEPPNSDLGDFCFGCFQMAKPLRQSPAKIATDLQDKLKAKAADHPLIESVQGTGPYLNFRLAPELVGELLLKPILNGSFFQIKLTEKTPKTMIEFSQPNTHKELHVGHMRNTCLGDALVRIKRYAGYEIISSTFPGDMGTHVAKCLWYLKYHNTEPVPDSGRGEWLGRMYSKGNLKLEDDIGTAKEAENREQLTQILKQLEAKQGEFYDLWKLTREWSIELMKSVYEWIGVEFDQWYWESEIDTSSVQYVKSLYQQGQLVLSDGAIGMDLSQDNLGFCLLLKADGTGLYATKDLELARRKFQDFHIERSIYVVDVRQTLHFQQVFKVLEHLGFEQAKNCFHLAYNFVELPDGAMSSRKGNIVPLTSLVHNMEKMVKENYLSRYENEWSKEEIDLVAKEVAQGAIKYGMVKIDTNKKIVFDMKEWLKLDGDSGPFIQYSTARIRSLVKKLGPLSSQVDYGLLTHPAERRLIAHLMNFHMVVLSAAEGDRPAMICGYLLETAKKFNSFYHECSIGQAGSDDLKNARLALAAATGEILKNGLALLGIPAPERM